MLDLSMISAPTSSHQVWCCRRDPPTKPSRVIPTEIKATPESCLFGLYIIVTSTTLAGSFFLTTILVKKDATFPDSLLEWPTLIDCDEVLGPLGTDILIYGLHVF